MYCEFYGLKERPFNVTADPAFFFLSSHHKEALAHLHYGVRQRKGIIVITGEIGTGKTILCKFFLSQLDNKIKTALILNPYFSEIQLLEAIVKDFGINIKSKTRFSMIWELNNFLLKESEVGNNILLIIDESQNLKPHQLEQIRLLSNLETEKNKLLQIILVGQPELNRKLNLYELRQLQQRIMVRYHIVPLVKKEVGEYIQHRLNIAGPANRIKFTDEAVQVISDFSSGLPRLINIICDRALLAGFVKEADTINIDIINKCTEELEYYFARQK
jgi:general secretion pathway protein A